jgi:FeS assembly SUF system protein
MGMFSFLTGSKSDEVQEALPPTAPPEPSAAPAVAVAEVPSTSTTPPAAPASQTPFTAPSAWTSSGMSTPRPESAHDQLVVGPLDPEQTAALQAPIIERIKTVFDPEIPVDIYELGLIYDIIVDANRNVLVNMTLTSPACPSAQQLPVEVRNKVKMIPEVNDAKVEIVWEPAWGKERMSEAAKLTLGFF